MIDDRQLQQDVLAELDFEPSINSAHIGVSAHTGVVTLSGFVGSYAEKLAAERAAQRVKGVKAIAEEIEVRPLQTRSAQMPRLSIETEGGEVTLRARLGASHERGVAQRAAWSVPGVTRVHDLTVIEA